MKVCSRCKIPKPVSEFKKASRYADGRYCWCAACCQDYSTSPETRARNRERRKIKLSDPKEREAENAYRRARYATPQEKRRHKNEMYQRKYGITLEFFEARCEKLANRCEICDRERALIPDHNHDTDKFRGAICYQCNLGLGAIEALPGLIAKFQIYIKERP